MLTVERLNQTYGPKQVLFDVDMAAGEGEILVVMGGSGGGKTTLLKCISGLVPIKSGDVLAEGVSVRTSPVEARAKMGMVFQYAALFDYLNVHDNILFGLRRRRKLSAKEGDRIVSEQLESVGLEGTGNLMPSELSGGMKKRVGLARALAMEPKILLYDEPTSGLDPVTAFAIDGLIKETRDRTKATSFVVSHDVNSALRLADRIAFLHKGKVVFFGSPREFRTSKVEPILELVQKASAVAL